MISSARHNVSWLFRLAMILVRRPGLVGAALKQSLALAPARWWRTWPPLPLPDPAYLRFRTVTAYGGDGTTKPDPADVEAWLAWVQSWPDVVSP